MKITPECVPCLLRRCLYETALVNPTKGAEVVREVCRIFAKEYAEDVPSAVLATKVHRRVYELLGTSDPYREVKKRSNEVALTLVPTANSFIENAEDRLRSAIICAITGNNLDFGIAGGEAEPEAFADRFGQLYTQGLGVDDTELIKEYLKEDARILFFADNCGEIVFDKLLCRELKRFGVKLTVVVRGEPILSDATLEEASELGFNEVADELMTSSTFAVGIAFDKITPALRRRIESADLIICKGMANYEAFSETNYAPIAYLLRTKCAPVARSMGLPQNINVAKLYKVIE